MLKGIRSFVVWRVVHPLVLFLCDKIQPRGICDGFPTGAASVPRCAKHNYPLMGDVCRVCRLDDPTTQS